MQPRAKDWVAFWDADPPIYANARHKELHYAELARGVAEHLPAGEPRVLDYGCGEALGAEWLARRCGALFLYDASPQLRRRLRDRCAGVDRLRILDDGELGKLEAASLDLILVASVIQYLSREALGELLELCRDKLRADGALLIVDVPPTQTSIVADAVSLLAFGARGGFLTSAIVSLARLFFSDYRRLRREAGFTSYDATDLEELLRAHGFVMRQASRNLGHNSRRAAFIARLATA